MVFFFLRTTLLSVDQYFQMHWGCSGPVSRELSSGPEGPGYTFGGAKVRELSPLWRMKISMACLLTILRDESQTVGK